MRLVLEELLLDSMVLHPMQARLLASFLTEWESTSLCRLQRRLLQVGVQDAYTAGTVWQTIKPYVPPRLCERKAPPIIPAIA